MCNPLEYEVSQGTVFSSMLFNIYMFLLTQLVCRLGLGCHQYADDAQFYLFLDSCVNSAPEILDQTWSCGWIATEELAEIKSNEDGSFIPESGGGNRIGGLAPHHGWYPVCAEFKGEKPRGNIGCFTLIVGKSHCTC